MKSKKRIVFSIAAMSLFLLFAFLPTSTFARSTVLKLAPGGIPNDKAIFGAIPEWAEQIESRTDGRIKVEVYYGQTLARGRENIDALSSDLADVIFPAPHHQPGKLPLFTIGNVPGLTNDYWAKAKAFYELLMTEKALLDEFAKYGGHPIGAAYYTPVAIISTEPIKTLDDVKGRKISAMYPASNLLAKLGAAPLSISPHEQYESLLRKTVDGSAAPVTAVTDFKFYEVAKYFTTFNLGDRNHALVINDSTFKRLSPEDQKIIDDFAPAYTQLAYEQCAWGYKPRGTDILINNGVKIIAPSKADSEKLLMLMDELADAWVKEMDGKGLPGTQLMRRYKGLIMKYEAMSPYR